ncbi:MAG TPA: amino acid permease, partial [Acidimicrobiales bacterium]|nr:amino acid permease [Acidimicrobiales bacterium]
AAFSLVVPVTLAIICVLAIVTALYRQVVKAYPKAGGAYVVSRENLGALVSEVAAASLLIDYTLTVAVSVAAGTAAITSAVPSLGRATTVIGIGFVLLLAYGNLRGLREAGRSFAVPTFFFIANMAALAVVGTVRAAAGRLHAHSVHLNGAFHPGNKGSGLFLGASLFIVLKAYASGGSALTGTEAISNGVSVFRTPQARNARQTLVWMAVILGSMFLVVSVFAALTHPVPYESGTPTVISQVARYVYGTSAAGHFLYYMMQTGTALILILAANTSFTGFPFLASFAAEDAFLPRQLMRRGHRLVFSNGIIVLTLVSSVLILATHSNLDSLINMYAVGVFTGFTLSGAGMVKHHWTQRERGWQRNIAICAAAAVLTFIVDIVIVVTKFTGGAWVVVVLMPVMVYVFIRLNRQYQAEDAILETGAQKAAEAPILRRHVVVVMVDRLDMATARAIQYARGLNPDELRAVHFVIDARHARELAERWGQLGLRHPTLELIDCPDRRLGRAALELAAEQSADGDTEVSILLPRRAYTRSWSRILHDQTADRIVAEVSQLPHVNATIVPFHVDVAMLSSHGRRLSRARRAAGAGVASGRRTGGVPAVESVPAGTVAVRDVEPRRPARVAGRVRAVRVQPYAGVQSLECTLVDANGDPLTVVFLGRRRVAGVSPGAKLAVEGVVSQRDSHLAMLNPLYELLGPSPDAE